MAHGGTAEWNAGIRAAVEPLSEKWPVAIAFGMADAKSLEVAVRELESQAVTRVGVVRLFISGDSWLERTEQILGLVPGAPPKPAAEAGRSGEHGSADHAASSADHTMTFYAIPTLVSFALSTDGLMDAPQAGAIIAERATGLSNDPGDEDVLVLAHGPGDEESNQRWLTSLEARAETVRQARPFRRVQVETLSEDWPERRVLAEQRIRDFVRRANDEGGRALVVPFRLFGFGPYAEVLEGLAYEADRMGLLPHASITDWLMEQAVQLADGPFRGPQLKDVAGPGGAH